MLQYLHNQMIPNEPDRIRGRLAGEGTLENLMDHVSAEGARRQPNLSGKRTEGFPFPIWESANGLFSLELLFCTAALFCLVEGF